MRLDISTTTLRLLGVTAITLPNLLLVIVLFENLTDSVIISTRTFLFILGAVGLIALFFVFFIGLSTRPSTSHDIAIIGFPKSGKTTLITSLFGEIFSQKLDGIQASLSGRNTIERVNADLELLEKGQALGPTQDQDIFAYRTTITTGSWLFKRSYKVQIGDFPGEDSQEYADNLDPSLGNLDFFRWVSEANGIVFMVDVARLLQPEETRKAYIAEISSEFRSKWQYLIDYNFSSKNPSVLLVFAKSDLFNLLQPASVNSSGIVDDEASLFTETLMSTQNSENMLPDTDETTLILTKIAQLGFSDTIPSIQQIEPDRLAAGERLCLHAFKNLIDYLRKEAHQFNIVFVSSFGTVDQQSRLGFHDLVKYMLPA